MDSIREEQEARREADAETGAVEEAAHFDAFQGIVVDHAPTQGAGRRK